MALVIGLAVRKTPAVATILAGALAGVLFALVFQRPAILAMASSEGGGTSAVARVLWTVLFDGYAATTAMPTSIHCSPEAA